MKRMINQRTYADADIPHGEVFTQPSLTIPDHVPTPRELLARFKRGEDISVFDPVFTDSEFIPDDVERMDRLQKLDLAREIKESVEATRKRLNSPRKAAVKEGLSPSESGAAGGGASGPGDGPPGADASTP